MIQIYFAHIDKLLNIAFAIALITIGFFSARWLGAMVEKALKKRFTRHQTMLTKRAVFYLIFVIFTITALQHLGFNLSILLGAAGVFTLAISFAAQTAVSNLISGIFLLFERPFKIGDTIDIKGTTGIVDAIDLLSTKLKTPDNKLVRIPNEAMIKSEITNLSYFPTRRIDITIAIAYDSDIAEIKTKLLYIADSCALLLKEPAPKISVNIGSNSAMEVIFMAWANTAQFSLAKSAILDEINQHLDKEKVDSSQIIVHRA